MRPLPAVLLDLHEDITTGRLTLRRGRVSKAVDLVNGLTNVMLAIPSLITITRREFARSVSRSSLPRKMGICMA